MGQMKRFAEDVGIALGRDLDNHGDLDDDVLHVVQHLLYLIDRWGLEVNVVDNTVVVSGTIKTLRPPSFAGEFTEDLNLPDPK